MNIITEMIVKADVEVHHLTREELGEIYIFIQKGDLRLRTTKALTQSHDLIVKQAANELFINCLLLAKIYNNAHDKEMVANCFYLRDMDYYLRLVSYSIIAGNNTPIKQIDIVGTRQMYIALGTPIELVAESIRNLKKVAIALLPSEDLSEVNSYFDYLISALE